MRLSAIRLENVRVFESEHTIPIASGLTVLMGRNNAGKSTIIRAPFAFIPPSSGNARVLHQFRRTGSEKGAIGLRFTLSAAECQAKLGIQPGQTDTIRAVAPTQPARNLPFSGTSAFAAWWNEPVVEVGVKWEGSKIGHMLRLIGAKEGYLEIAESSGGARIVMDGTPYTSAEDLPWLHAVLTHTLRDRNGSFPPELLAHWEPQRTKGASDWIDQHSRRPVDADEARLQETLTFLRMKHAVAFERISEALCRALPEFGSLDFIDTEGKGFNYRPGFVAAGAGAFPLARESIGSGAWNYLCILTAARAAKATGARVLFLDEPHLYMHPGLERQLVDELLDPERWDDMPLQIVASTHSPTFVNAAAESGALHVLRWADPARTTVGFTSIDRRSSADLLDVIPSQVSDLLYADKVVFVEGPSDAVAMKILARERCSMRRPFRFVPLRETDATIADITRYFRVIAATRGLGFDARGLLVLDGDKRHAYERAWGKLSRDDDPRERSAVAWADGNRGNDLESVFCNEDFLVAYFDHPDRSVAEQIARPEIQKWIGNVVLDQVSVPKAKKGCVAIRGVHEALLGTDDGSLSKADDLENLMRFYVQQATEPFAEPVRARLADLELALTKLASDNG